MDRTFCLTVPTFRRYSLTGFILCLACSTWASVACAQGGRGRGGPFSGGGGFSPQDFFDRLDQDGDGRLEGNEIPDGPMRGMLEAQGLDLSRPVALEDFVSAQEGMRQRFREGGDGGRGDGGERRRGDGEGGRGFRDFGSQQNENDENEEESPAVKEPRPRATIELPASFTAGDTDRDGQVGLYEWRRWNGKSLSEFLQMDRNGDGFLTPREIVAVIGLPETPGTTTASAGEVAANSVTNPSGSGSPATTNATSPDRLTADAQRFFGILDKDRDGAISSEEWASSVRIGGMFREAGVDLSQPMSSELFVETYVRLESAGG